MDHARGAALPKQIRSAKRPWISSKTLRLLDERDNARRIHDFSLLSRDIKRQIKYDRSTWLNDRVADNDWSALRELRQKPPQQNPVVRNPHGDIVDSSQTAETFANYYASTQLGPREITPIDPNLPSRDP